jgi:ADP-ribose pyrophosphatase
MSDPNLLFQGKHLNFLDRDGWEYVEHRTAPEAAMVVALTDRGEIVLTEEFRPALDAFVIALPSGLVGDEGPEDAIDAARRELAEETGHAAARFRRLARGPGSAGQSSEMITFFLAEGVRVAGEQAAHDRGKIRVHVVPVARLLHWARARERRGAIVDPKIFAGLFLATSPSGRSSRRPFPARRGRARSSKPSSPRRTRPRRRSGR